MVCVYCGGKLGVSNSRPQKRSNQVWRRRQCKECLATFTSHEVIDLASALLVQASPTTAPAPFHREKLFTEVLLALQDKKNPYETASEITKSIVANLLKLPEKPVIKPSQITSETAKVLRRFDRRGFLRYQAEHPSLL